MRLVFLTFAPLSSSAGHLARLSFELKNLQKTNEISVVCLGKYKDDKETQCKYDKVRFYHLPIKFNGWNVVDVKGVSNSIYTLVGDIKPQLVVLQMEVWDLMMKLEEVFSKKFPFAVTIHAMPFLGSPVSFTGDFEKDVIKSAESQVELYKKEYILKHYTEARILFSHLRIIANNATVACYLHTYFPHLNFWIQTPSIVIPERKHLIANKHFQYDFVYMARMESGKGVEYLEKIIPLIYDNLGRPFSVLILGRTDDALSTKALHRLIKISNYRYKVTYGGWANTSKKALLLPDCGVFIYPSHHDNYPTVLSEALSIGLPCITWKVPFSELNFSETLAVKKVDLFDFATFAKEAVMALNNRDILMVEARRFVKSFPSKREIAKSDTVIFKDISQS
ncbi:MAG: glycosyltransferase [bacterium]